MGQLVDLTIRPGVYTDQTDRGAAPYWHDGDRIRFRNGLAEQIGGWQAVQNANGDPITVTGAARAIHDWSSLDSQSWVAIGTHLKLVLVNGAHVYDITPVRFEADITGCFAINAGSTTLHVAHSAHGADEGDYLRLSAPETAPGAFVAGEHRVAKVLGIGDYEIELDAPAPTSLSLADSSVYHVAYDIHIGPRSREIVRGYGVAGFGAGAYGTPREHSTLYQPMRIWSLDNWGEDLMASPLGGPVYWWDRSAGPNTRAQRIEAAPATNRWISVSPEDRHLVCFGAHTTTHPDPMLVRWSDTEDFNTFLPTRDNTAGDKRLDAGSKIVTAIDTRGEKLIFTDEAVYAMQFLGGNAVFGFSPLGRSVAIIGPNAAATVNGVVYFMGTDDFFVYDGVMRPLGCPVRNHVFNDLDDFQGARVYAAINREATEIMWLYPSADAADNDRYVIYNYAEQLWYFGTMARSAFHEATATYGLPYGLAPDGTLYQHETGTTADGAPLGSWLESYDVDLGTGQQFMAVRRLIPDFVALDGAMTVSLLGQRYSQGTREIAKGPYDFDGTTDKISVRARNRQIALRIAANQTGVFWRMGTWRAEVAPHGTR